MKKDRNSLLSLQLYHEVLSGVSSPKKEPSSISHLEFPSCELHPGNWKSLFWLEIEVA